MSSEKFAHFLAVARHQHMGRAAEELGISQSALSRSIARFESPYGSPLFNRPGRKIELNAFGMVVLQSVERAETEIENGLRRVREMRGASEAIVSLGFTASFGTRVIPQLIGSFRDVSPMADFRFTQGPYPELRDQLLRRKIDLAFASPAFSDPHIEAYPLWEEELVVVVPATHRLAGRGAVDLYEFAGDEWISLKRRFGLRNSLESLAGGAGFTPHIHIETHGIGMLQGLVAAGFGVALLPRDIVRAIDDTATLTIGSPRCYRTMYLSMLKNRDPSQTVTSFRDHAIKMSAVHGS